MAERRVLGAVLTAAMAAAVWAESTTTAPSGGGGRGGATTRRVASSRPARMPVPIVNGELTAIGEQSVTVLAPARGRRAAQERTVAVTPETRIVFSKLESEEQNESGQGRRRYSSKPAKFEDLKVGQTVMVMSSLSEDGEERAQTVAIMEAEGGEEK